jgi:hypothetical protein
LYQTFNQNNDIKKQHNEKVISAFSMGVSDIKMREKLSMNDELTSVVRLFEIADRCAKAEEGRLFVHNLPEALPPKPKSKDPKCKEAAVLAAEPDHKQRPGDRSECDKGRRRRTASSTKRTPTIPTIVGLSGSFMKKMVSPRAMGVAVATARVDLGAITAMTTGMRVATAMVCLVQIPSHFRCLHRRMIIGKRTRGDIKSREASPLSSWVEPKLLCLIVTSSSCRERSRRRSPAPATA